METQADGSLIVTFGAQGMNYAASMIMSYGPLVEVLEPKELRETFVNNQNIIKESGSEYFLNHYNSKVEE